jgi:hypothetical protein
MEKTMKAFLSILFLLGLASSIASAGEKQIVERKEELKTQINDNLYVVIEDALRFHTTVNAKVLAIGIEDDNSIKYQIEHESTEVQAPHKIVWTESKSDVNISKDRIFTRNLKSCVIGGKNRVQICNGDHLTNGSVHYVVDGIQLIPVQDKMVIIRNNINFNFGANDRLIRLTIQGTSNDISFVVDFESVIKELTLN